MSELIILLGLTSPDGNRVFVKAIAGPYVGPEGFHALVIPDRSDGELIKEVGGLTTKHLAKALETAESLADKVLDEGGLNTAEIGIHYSEGYEG